MVTVIALLLMTLTQIYAEKSKTELQADEAYKAANFSEAINKYEHTKNISVDGRRKLARCYQYLEDFTNATRVFEDIIKDEYADQDDYWNYMVVLKQMKEYDKANKWMTEFAKSLPEDLRTKSFLRSGIGNTIDNTDKYQVKDLSFNDANSDFSPAFYGDKTDKIIFTTNRNTGSDGFSDLSIASVASSGQFFDVKKLDDINTKWHEGVASVTADGKLMAYTTNDYKDKKRLEDSKLQLMFAKMQSNGKWGEIESFKLNSPDYSVGHPSLSANGKVMYFASDMPGGFGGIDIYRIERQSNGEWGKPVNMGNKVNTEGDEMFPFYDETTKTLYYSSNGLSGFGGLDVYMASDGKLAVNMGAPINTERDDFGFIINKDQKSGYFSSTRDGGKGSDDIYYFTINEILPPSVAMNTGQKHFINNALTNTPKDDFAPAYYSSPNTLIYASNRNDSSEYPDLYTVPVTGYCQFGSATPVAELNTRWYEGPASVSADGKYIAFTKTNAETDPTDPKYQLYFATKQIDGKWGNIESFRINDPSYSIAYPSLSADGKTLYFSSDMPGGYGGMDLYKSQKVASGEWSAPTNLGKGINTQGDEVYPFIDANNNLYFSSNGLGGLGGFDIFKATQTEGIFGSLINMDTPTNSDKDDFGYIIAKDGKSGYFTSNRANGKGGYDIYCFSDEAKSVAPAVLTVADVPKPASVDLPVQRDRKGRMTITLRKIYYNVGKWDLLPASYGELNILADYMLKNPELKVEVGSHTDSRGSDASNLTLSQKRSQSVVNYLISQGIASDRMFARGYGETELLNRCRNGVKCSEDEHLQNRRTEFVLLDKNGKPLVVSDGVPTTVTVPVSSTTPTTPSSLTPVAVSTPSSTGYAIISSFAQKSQADKAVRDLAAIGERGVILSADGRYRVGVPCDENTKQAVLSRLKPVYSGAWYMAGTPAATPAAPSSYQPAPAPAYQPATAPAPSAPVAVNTPTTMSYVVVASFAQKAPADKVIRDLAAMGERGVIINNNDGRFRVGVPCDENTKQATLERLKPTYTGAWIYNVK